MELETILTDKNWEKLGACKIECINVFDASLKPADRVSLPDDIVAINERIQKIITVGTKPKTEIDLLKEQIAALNERINNPYVPEKKKELTEDQRMTGDLLIHQFAKTPPIGSIIRGTEPFLEPEKTEKEIRESLFAEAKELGLTPAKNVKTEILKDLVEKAKSGK